MTRLFLDLIDLLMANDTLSMSGTDGVARCTIEWRPGEARAWWLITPDRTEAVSSAGELMVKLRALWSPEELARCVQVARYRSLFPQGSSLEWQTRRLSDWLPPTRSAG